jgi:hypothetical protein
MPGLVRSNTVCDNPVVGKHLGVNTRLLAEVYYPLRYIFRLIKLGIKIYENEDRCSPGIIYTLYSSFGPSVCTPTAYRT